MADQSKSRAETASRTSQDTIGLEDLTRSVRGLARATRNLGEATYDVAERELNMAIRISEQIRDSVISKDAIEKTHKSPIPASLRDDAHRIVDLVADVGLVIGQSAVEFLERFADDRRPPTAKERVDVKEG